MAENTKIEWTDHTFNPWRGCVEVHAGCDNCYARTMSKRNPATLGVWGPSGTRVVASEAQWKLPIKWDREALKRRAAWSEDCAERDSLTFPGRPRRPRVFCASLADVFEDWTGPLLDSHGRQLFRCCHCGNEWATDMAGYDPAGPCKFRQRVNCMECGSTGPNDMTLNDVRRRLFALIDATPNLDWLLVTKRPKNVRRMWPKAGFPDAGVPGTLGKYLYLSNVWLLTSISDQATADSMIPELLKCRDLCPVLGLSAEPLLGPVNLEMIRDPKRFPGCAYFDVLRGRMIHEDDGNKWTADRKIDWVIIGGESGPGARPCQVAWIRDLVMQCKTAKVPAFVKQLGSRAWADCGSNAKGNCSDGSCFELQLRDKKGGDPAEWPEDLRVREFPEVQS